MENRWLSVEEIAYLGVSRDTVYAWVGKQKGFPAHKVGRLWKFKTDEIDRWVRSGGGKAKDKQ